MKKKEGRGPFFLLQNGRQTNFPKLLSIETYSDKTGGGLQKGSGRDAKHDFFTWP